MRTLVRTLLLLSLSIWIGGLIFFAFIEAPVAFLSLADTHQAGIIVGTSLRILHWMGLGCGIALLLLFTMAGHLGIYAQQRMKLPLIAVLFMLALTAFSQFSIIPHMEQYRIQSGGAINRSPQDDPSRIAFNRLHKVSEKVEGGVLLCGVALLFLLAHAEKRQEL
jgi:uncharacterized membrane protein